MNLDIRPCEHSAGLDIQLVLIFNSPEFFFCPFHLGSKHRIAPYPERNQLPSHHPPHPQVRENSPSTFKSHPVINFPASPQSNTTAPVKSSGSPIPNGHFSNHFLRNPFWLSPPLSLVFMMPGLMLLTLMPWPTHSPARERARWWMPALETA